MPSLAFAALVIERAGRVGDGRHPGQLPNFGLGGGGPASAGEFVRGGAHWAQIGGDVETRH